MCLCIDDGGLCRLRKDLEQQLEEKEKASKKESKMMMKRRKEWKL